MGRDFLPTLYIALLNRSHDSCDVIVERGECLEGVCNGSMLFPILGCHCEVKFKKCLKVRGRREREEREREREREMREESENSKGCCYTGWCKTNAPPFHGRFRRVPDFLSFVKLRPALN